ncbi:OmpH/Skp family outer membrane protein [Actibacterium sp. D379-3]
MRRRSAIVLCLVAGLALSGVAAPLRAQEQDVVRSPIVTVDQERLFTQSAYGQAILDQIEAESAELGAENRRIEAELVAEERALTEQRPTLDPAAFRAMAAAFDEKVVAIRKAQDDKTRALVRRRETAQKDFFTAVLPILTEIVRERGAVAVLETRAVILSADQIDITGAAIERIDQRLMAPVSGGDSAAPPAPD